jgi:hypothetical protein
VKLQLERAFACILIAVGLTVISLAVFQGYFYEKELAVFGETMGETGIGKMETVGGYLMWLLTLLAQLLGGFFLASIGIKVIKK